MGYVSGIVELWKTEGIEGSGGIVQSDVVRK